MRGYCHHPGGRRLRLREVIRRPKATKQVGGGALGQCRSSRLWQYSSHHPCIPQKGLPGVAAPLEERQRTRATSCHASLTMVRGGLLQAKVLPAQASTDPGKPLSPPANVACAQGAGLGLREAGGGLGQAVPSSCQMTLLARKPTEQDKASKLRCTFRPSGPGSPGSPGKPMSPCKTETNGELGGWEQRRVSNQSVSAHGQSFMNRTHEGPEASGETGASERSEGSPVGRVSSPSPHNPVTPFDLQGVPQNVDIL